MNRKAFLAGLVGLAGVQAQSGNKIVKRTTPGTPPPKMTEETLALPPGYQWSATPTDPPDGQCMVFMRKGKYRNGMCPVCGEMAEPWHTWRDMCTVIKNNVMTLEPCPKMVGQIVRCARCSAAFWQDAEEKK